MVLHPDAPLQANTPYTLTPGSGLQDMSGNPLFSPAPISFTTTPYVTAPAAAPFITALVPGLPCALDPVSSDFSGDGQHRRLLSR